MALAISNLLQCPNLPLSQKNFLLKVSETSLSSVRFSKINGWSGRRVICAAASAAGSSNSDGDLNPYEVLGVSPIAGFDMIKAAYTKKQKEAERIGDEELLPVSKDIKYSDKQLIVPWGPRSMWRLGPSYGCCADTCLRVVCMEDVEDTGEGLRMGKRLLRALALVFGCIAVSSLAYTGLLNFIGFSGGYIPALLYNSQEGIMTTSSAVMLYIMESFYRQGNFSKPEGTAQRVIIQNWRYDVPFCLLCTFCVALLEFCSKKRRILW